MRNVAANKFLNKFVNPVAFRRLILLFLLLGSLFDHKRFTKLSRYFALTVVGIFVIFANLCCTKKVWKCSAKNVYIVVAFQAQPWT